MKKEQKSIVKIQSLVRMYKQKQQYSKLLKIVKIQSIYKMVLRKRKYRYTKQQVVKIQYNFRRYRTMKKLENIRIARITSWDIFKTVWLKIKERWYGDAAVHIQKRYRGMRCRKQNKKKIEQIRKARLDFICQKVATKLQKIVRGFLVRRRMRNKEKAVMKIQRYCRARWARLIFQQVTKSVKMI